MNRRHLIAVAVIAVTCLVSVVLAAAPFTMTSVVAMSEEQVGPTGTDERVVGFRELHLECDPDGVSRYVTAQGAPLFFNLTGPPPPGPLCEDARRSRRLGAGLLMAVAAMVGFALVRRRPEDDLLDGQQVAEADPTGTPGGVEAGQ